MAAHHADSARFCSIVQGVTFTFGCIGRVVRALVPSDTLESVFGAQPDQASWMETFNSHEPVIVETARRRFAAELEEPVVLWPSSFGGGVRWND